MAKNKVLSYALRMPLKGRTFKTLTRLMTDDELAKVVVMSGGQRFLKAKEFIDVMEPRHVAQHVLKVLSIVTAIVVVSTIIATLHHSSSPTYVMYSVGLSLWLIPAIVFALDEKKNNIRKARALSRVFWLTEFREYRHIGQTKHKRYLPYFNMREPSAIHYSGIEN